MMQIARSSSKPRRFVAVCRLLSAALLLATLALPWRAATPPLARFTLQLSPERNGPQSVTGFQIALTCPKSGSVLRRSREDAASLSGLRALQIVPGAASVVRWKGTEKMADRSVSWDLLIEAPARLTR